MDGKIGLKGLVNVNLAPNKNTLKKARTALILLLSAAAITACSQNKIDSLICYAPLLIIFGPPLLGLIGTAIYEIKDKIKPPEPEKPPPDGLGGNGYSGDSTLGH